MKKLEFDPKTYKPTELSNVPRIGSDDPNEKETQCEKCGGVVAVLGRIYCVSGVKWCSCPAQVDK